MGSDLGQAVANMIAGLIIVALLVGGVLGLGGYFSRPREASLQGAKWASR